jgi:hypothetical protein
MKWKRLNLHTNTKYEMLIMKGILSILLLLYTITGFTQNKYYTTPVKIPIQLSASFGELRSNHFHSGIDIKTQGVTGLPVNAVADGFISRIAVSPSGFGNVLYIDHPNGTTTVYGHLMKFREDIQEYVRNIQYKNKTFQVDILVPRDSFPVLQNEIIAQSGNTGSSGGPHLHFEIRDTQSEEPLNPLKYNFPVNDNTAPKVFSLLIEPLSEDAQVNFSKDKKAYSVVFYDGKYRVSKNPVIPVYGEIGFAVQANDYFDNSWNKCGLYSLELFIDGMRHFSFQMDRFSFEKTRYINSYIDYETFISQKRRYQKTWVEQGNKLTNYNFLINRGIIEIKDENIHHVQMVLKDTYGNTSELIFDVNGSSSDIKTSVEKFTEKFDYDKNNQWQNNHFHINVPKGALYANLNFIHKEIPADDFFSSIHVVDRNTVPLQKSAIISIKTKNLPQSLYSKALIVNVDTLTDKRYASGGIYKDGWVETKINYFGNYAVAVDTVPPTILSLSIKDKNTLNEPNRIRFKIDDDLAGIDSYEGIIDGKWALFEYDLKNKLIIYKFDKKRIEMNKRHTLVFKVTDSKGNTAIYEATFWK